jgi:hypothetical protein
MATVTVIALVKMSAQTQILSVYLKEKESMNTNAALPSGATGVGAQAAFCFLYSIIYQAVTLLATLDCESERCLSIRCLSAK